MRREWGVLLNTVLANAWVYSFDVDVNFQGAGDIVKHRSQEPILGCIVLREWVGFC